jgi:hypothetical protein
MRQEKNKEEERIRYVLESRLRMQSVQRELDRYKIPKRNFEYFKSSDFKRDHLEKLNPFQKRELLKTIVGVNWKQLQQMLEKE